MVLNGHFLTISNGSVFTSRIGLKLFGRPDAVSGKFGKQLGNLAKAATDGRSVGNSSSSSSPSGLFFCA